jgi:tetratricopeptide (TPR) repeat protein
VVAGAVAWRWAHPERYGGGSTTSGAAARFSLEPQEKVFADYAGSESCRACHAEAFEKWKGSHHGLAERAIDPQLDRAAFEPPRQIKTGSQVSEARTQEGRFQLVTQGADGKPAAFTPDRVIGVNPLRQFLVPFPRGRWQTAELAWDPHRQEWFNVFGDEDRQAGEWGHWTGRGMTWNQMCASCHNTRVRKNYDPATDTYRTAMAAMTVGCEACHGPMRQHVDWQKDHPGRRGDPTLVKFAREQTLDTCGMCHARRGELTGDFKPGDRFFDHFQLTIPDETDIFYPDGQVRDEDYEFTSFLSSKMHGAGVRCADCHDLHSGKNILPGNVLCMRCHGPPVPPAPKIADPAHSFHKPGTPGSLCVDCHMPETTYMQRHPRRDHGFTIPDPLLTKQHGIPNACNRCHADKSADWALEFCDQWYGGKMNRPTRARAQWVAQARAGVPGAHTNLLRMLTEEKLPLWRGVAANLLRLQTHEPGVVAALIQAGRDTNELVRAMAARALETPAQQRHAAAEGALASLLNDPVRAVRIEAAWGLRQSVDTNGRAGSELIHYLNLNRDQPLGLYQWGNFLSDRGDRDGALAAYRQAVQWDPGSPPLRHAYAITLSQAGRGEEAARELAEACRRAPRDAQLRFTYALSLNELGRAREALAALEETVKLDPQFARAWYNLGLARNAAQQTEPALDALARAEYLEPRDPQAPYAAATILARLQRAEEARAAARRALQIAPNHAEAAELLRALSGGR